MHYNFVVHPHYARFEDELKKVLQNFSSNGEYVTRGQRNIIKMIKIDDTFFNIKKFKTPNIPQSFIYRYLRKSKAKRSFEYAQNLIDLNINTPHPVAYMEGFSLGLVEGYYISLHQDYDFDFRELIHKQKFPNREVILKQFTQFTFKLHENNVNFLDHSPGNTLIVDRNKDGQNYDFYLIDLNRMRFEPMTFEKRMSNFRRLWLSKKMIKIIAQEYAELYGKTYDEVHALMTKYSREYQKKINSKKLRRRNRVSLW